jgi:hypothetical protein
MEVRMRTTRHIPAVVLVAIVVGGAPIHKPLRAQALPPALGHRLERRPLWHGAGTLAYAPEDAAVAEALAPDLERAMDTIEAFFGTALPRELPVTIVPDRSSFSAVLDAEWGVGDTACWMVATAVDAFMVVLSPRVWEAEACEHDPADPQHVRDILTHELVHAYHGQHNPTGDFTGADEIGWFAEGLAVHVAGQLDRGRLAEPAEAIRTGAAPARLVDAWSGTYRYGVSGSIVAFIEAVRGRETIVRLLAVTDQEGLLREVGMTEEELLAGWRRRVLASGG